MAALGLRGFDHVRIGAAHGGLEPLLCGSLSGRLERGPNRRDHGRAGYFVADAFKYRSKLGLDVALEALRTWRGRRGAVIERLLEQARVCRVERVMRPYLEAMI